MEHVTAHQSANLDVTKHSFTHRIHSLSLWLNTFIFLTEVAKFIMLSDAVSYNTAVKRNKEIQTHRPSVYSNKSLMTVFSKRALTLDSRLSHEMLCMFTFTPFTTINVATSLKEKKIKKTKTKFF